MHTELLLRHDTGKQGHGDQTDALLQNPCMFGYCYTQLTDVEQEQNGIYTYDRREKFPVEVLREIFGGKAAIEE